MIFLHIKKYRKKYITVYTTVYILVYYYQYYIFLYTLLYTYRNIIVIYFIFEAISKNLFQFSVFRAFHEIPFPQKKKKKKLQLFEFDRYSSTKQFRGTLQLFFKFLVELRRSGRCFKEFVGDLFSELFSYGNPSIVTFRICSRFVP